MNVSVKSTLSSTIPMTNQLLNPAPRRSFALLSGILLLTSSMAAPVQSQDSPPAMALTSVTLHQADGSVLPGASIVWRDGVIQAAGSGIQIPFDAYVIDGGDSLHVYPGFIDGLNTWGSPDGPAYSGSTGTPGSPTPARAGVQPERTPSTHMQADHKDYEQALKAGFTSANLVPDGRMLPGTSETALIDGSFSRADVIGGPSALVFRFQGAGGGWTDRAYPSTDMAVMAKFRQTMYDAQALLDHIRYTESRGGGELPVPERDPVLESMFPVLNGTLPVLFETDSPEDLERFLLIKDEFGFDAILASGKELSSRAGMLRQRGIPVLASIDVPDKPDWMKEQEKEASAAADSASAPADSEQADAEDGDAEELPAWAKAERDAFQARQREAWNRAVGNIRALREAGVTVGYAGHGLELKDLPGKLRLLVEDGGLTETDLLEMMTSNTARILGRDARMGSLKTGAIANLAVFDKPFTQSKASVVMTVTNGAVHEH